MTSIYMKKSKILFSIITLLAILSANILVANAANRTLEFGGYSWNVKNGNFGPGPNWWTDATTDVYTDANGALHLPIVNKNGTWYSSEIYLPNSLGYGTYRFETASRVDLIDPNMVLGLFLYQDDTHELDIEYSRWGWAAGPNVGYSVQPASTKGNNFQYSVTLQGAPVINKINWQADRIDFRISQNGTILNKWTYTGANNFIPGSERVHLNFWLMSGLAPMDGKNAEVIINKFEFIPQNVNTAIVEAPVTTTTTTTTTATTISNPAIETTTVTTPIITTTTPSVTIYTEPVTQIPNKKIQKDKKREEKQKLKEIKKELKREFKKELKEIYKRLFRK